MRNVEEIGGGEEEEGWIQREIRFELIKKESIIVPSINILQCVVTWCLGLQKLCIISTIAVVVPFCLW